jgi:thiamine-monophosphate kinase
MPTSHKRQLAQLGEFDWLKQLLPRLYWPTTLSPQLCIGPGDDAGVLRITPQRVLVATTDALVEGVHFQQKWFSPQALGEKLLSVNISDLAAMGRVKPLAVLVTAALPGDTPVDKVNKFYQGMHSCAQRWKIGFLGGDTVGSQRGWFVSATLLGEANTQELVQRQGARLGDLIVSVGPLGLAAAGLEVLQQNRTHWAWTRSLVQAFSRPLPQLAAGALLGSQGWATSMLDVSDGLEASIRLMAEASHLGAELDLANYPVPSALSRWARQQKRDPRAYVLRGGEDYALVFTTKPRNWPHLKRRLPQAQLLGRMTAARSGLWAQWNRKKFKLNSYGYAHF